MFKPDFLLKVILQFSLSGFMIVLLLDGCSLIVFTLFGLVSRLLIHVLKKFVVFWFFTINGVVAIWFSG